MRKKLNVIMMITALLFLMTACPDPSTVPEDQVSDNFVESPAVNSGYDDTGDVTEDSATRAASLILGVEGSDRFQDDQEIPGSGLVYVEVSAQTEQYVFTNYDISGFSFNTFGYLTMSGTLTFTETFSGMDVDYDFTLTGGDVSVISFVFSYDNDYNHPSTITVSIDSVEYTISFPTITDPAVTPWLTSDGCGITWDTSTFASILTPSAWGLPMPTDSKDAVTASKASSYVGCEIPAGSYSIDGYSYQYRIVDCTADVSSSGNGSGTLSVDARLDVDGIRGTCDDVFYSTKGAVGLHYVYFTAESDDPDTETISVEFTISSTGNLICIADEHALASVSLTANATIARMGMDEEHGKGVWTEVEYVWGDYDGSIGYAVLCDDGTHPSKALGIFEGDITGTPSDVGVDGSITADCNIDPEDEMMRLCLSLTAHSKVEFTGISYEFDGTGEAKCANAQLTYSYSACDPENPGADVTVKIFVPDF